MPSADGWDPGRRVYRTQERERRRRRRRRTAVVLLALVLVAGTATAAVLALRAEGPAGPPQAEASPAPPVRAQVGDARGRRGEAAVIRYRLDGGEDDRFGVRLRLSDEDGAPVKTKLLGTDVPTGAHTYRLRLDLPKGDYELTLLAASAGRETASAPGVLTVLPPPRPGFPSAAAIDRALDWANGREGRVSVAVVDSNGELRGLRQRTSFQSASLVKAMLLAASMSADPSDHSRDELLTRMIQESDNAAADEVYAQVGEAGLRALARQAGMRDFEPGAGWIDCRVTAADQALFFARFERYVPAARRGFARRLLGGVVPIQRWGIPAAAGPEGWRTFFKAGWLGLDNRLMVQAAWLERGRRRWALAVFTDDNPTKSAGWDTQKGVAGILLGREATPAYLSTVLEP